MDKKLDYTLRIRRNGKYYEYIYSPEPKYAVFKGKKNVFKTESKYELRIWLDLNGLNIGRLRKHFGGRMRLFEPWFRYVDVVEDNSGKH